MLILYNLFERLQKGEDKDLLAEDSVIEEIGAVEEAVRSLGHECFVLAIHGEIFTVVHWLQEIRPDVVFNLCEGVYGNSSLEMDIPALLELFRIPYTGSPPLTLGLCQDKGKVKDILQSHEIETPRYTIVDRLSNPMNHPSFPLIVKPLHEDGSLGISKESVVYDEASLRRQIGYILKTYDQPALVEEFVDGRELNVSLFERNGKVDVLPISEIDYSGFPEAIPRICGYEAKWIPESLEYQKSKPICPARLDPHLKGKVEQIAVRVFNLFEFRDYGRVDFRVGSEGRSYVIDVNPNPDISPQSGMSRAIKVQGMTYIEFVEGLLERVLQRRA